MEEKTLLKISVILTIIGIISLFIFTNTLNLENINIEQLEHRIDKDITIKGEVVSYRDYGKTAVIKLSQPATVDIFLFKRENLTIENGEFITVKGEVKEYAKGYQIVADTIQR